MIKDELIKDIVEWHYSAFPDCTLESQLLKVNGEMGEMFNAGTNDAEAWKERADVCIASIALSMRFNAPLGDYLMTRLYYECHDFERLRREIKEKMKINKSREWEKINGVHRHKSKPEQKNNAG